MSATYFISDFTPFREHRIPTDSSTAGYWHVPYECYPMSAQRRTGKSSHWSNIAYIISSQNTLIRSIVSRINTALELRLSSCLQLFSACSPSSDSVYGMSFSPDALPILHRRQAKTYLVLYSHSLIRRQGLPEILRTDLHHQSAGQCRAMLRNTEEGQTCSMTFNTFA
jgi:hypothetical protein